MNTKLSKDANALITIDKDACIIQGNPKNKKKNQQSNLLSESFFTQYKHGPKHSQQKGNNKHKSLYESLIVKSNLLTSTMISDDKLEYKGIKDNIAFNLSHNSNSSKSNNKNGHKTLNATLTIETSDYNKENLTIIPSKPSNSKKRIKGLNLIKTDVFKRINKEGINLKKTKQFDLIKSQINNLFKKSISKEKNKKKKIEPHHQPTKTVVEISSLLPKKNMNNKCISRSNSFSNLDKTTTEPTTTSKRLNDNIHKVVIHNSKPALHHHFKIQLNKDLNGIYSNNFITIKGSKNQNKRNNNQLSNSLSHNNDGCHINWFNNNSIDNPHLKTTINNPAKDLIKHKKSKSISKNMVQEKDKNKKQLNETGSLSFLSEDSAFYTSKHRSTSRQNKSNRINNNNQNDASSIKQTISLKNSSNNTSKNYDRKSISKDKSNSYGDATVSFTYSDDEITEQKSKRTRKNVGKLINDDDFYLFYTETCQKLFGCNK